MCLTDVSSRKLSRKHSRTDRNAQAPQARQAQAPRSHVPLDEELTDARGAEPLPGALQSLLEKNILKNARRDKLAKVKKIVVKDAGVAKVKRERSKALKEQFEKVWGEVKKAKKMIKFGGGFYCGKLETEQGELYVLNGFFMSMRAKFVEPGAAIHYYVVSWDASKTSWEDFRGKVLGATNPEEAEAGSVRRQILERLPQDDPSKSLEVFYWCLERKVEQDLKETNRILSLDTSGIVGVIQIQKACKSEASDSIRALFHD